MKYLALLASAALSAAIFLPGVAMAQLCSAPPHSVPGLPGAPNWSGGGTPVRIDRDDPRWAPAPVKTFASDVFGSLEGGHRMMYDPAAQQLVIALQMFSDPGGGPSSFDSVYLGLSTGPAGATAHGVRIDLTAPTGAADPKTLAAFVRHEYGGGVWTLPDGVFPQATAPSWLAVQGAWTELGAEWAVHVKVDLAALGLAPASAFRMALGMHASDDATAAAVDLTTPDVGIGGAVGDLLTMNPASWILAAAPDSGCAGGITLSSMQIGTTNAAAHKINTTNGAVNTFFAAPTVPVGMVTSSNVFQANFRIANWGSVADSNAPWTSVPGAAAVKNGAGTAPDNHTVHFTCPANAGGATCGMPTPAEDHQCMLVELSKNPESLASPVFSKAAAYRNMRFEALSEFRDTAEINSEGLEKVFGNEDARTLYIKIKKSNMPQHGDKPLWLRPRAMNGFRRLVEGVAQQAKGQAVHDRPVADARAREPGAALTHRLAAVPNRASKAPKTAPQLAGWPTDLWGYSDHGLLSKVWPTYEVHVYYEVGMRQRDPKTKYMRIEPMYPFVYYFEHEGPLFGFTDSIVGADVKVETVGKDFYKLTLPSRGKAKIAIAVRAEEEPLRRGKVESCPKCTNIVVKAGCGSCAVGTDGGSNGLSMAGLALAGLLVTVRLRRRRS